MKKVIIFFLLQSFFHSRSSANYSDTANCKCDYYSSYSLTRYLTNIDSIRNVLNIQYGKTIVIGRRNFSQANALFIVKIKKSYKGFYYDLGNKKKKVISGYKIDQMFKKILNDSVSIRNSCEMSSSYISHDFGFYVSLEKEKKIYEVCYSKVVTYKNTTFGKLFTYYLNNFN